jgi:acetyl-CoA synthetase
MSLLNRYLDRTQFDSYEDFRDHLKINVPENFNFAYDVVDVIAREEPGKRAILLCNDAGEEITLSFSDLAKLTNQTANYFQGLGIRKGDPVMLVMQRNQAFWYCLLALHKLGAVAIPATHMLTTRDLVYRIRRADIKMVVSVNAEGLLDYIDEAQKECPELLKSKVLIDGMRAGWEDFNGGIAQASTQFERPTGDQATANTDPMLLYFTSGTAGFPKMVQHNFTYPLGHILTASYWQNVIDGGLHYTVADTGWAKAVWGKIYGQWLGGSAVFVYDYDKFIAKNLLKKATEHGVTTFCAPPTVYRFLIKEDLSQYDFSSLKYCVVAGEPLNPEVYEQFLKATGMKLMEGYGQTELTITMATFPWMEPKPGSMGKPTPGYDIELRSLDGKTCEVGEEGEIVINTATRQPVGIFDGYYRDQEKTDAAWHDDTYHTGDMAWMDEDGYYWFVGRADDVIKTSGYKVGPFEVESALMQHPAVLECAITGAPDPVRGQVIKATVVLAQGYEAGGAMTKELQDHVKKVTAPYKYPRIIDFVHQLPKTISGKIRRVEIRDQEQNP